MNAKCKCRMVAAEFAIAALLLGACATGDGSIARPAASTAVPQSAENQAPNPESKKGSARPAVTPLPTEYLTLEGAAGHAADPKSPTGALIIKPPINVMPSDPPSSDPKQ